jgi:hypothetical protein
MGMYHSVTVTPTSLERELLACYAELESHGKIEQAIVHLAVQTARERLEHDPIFAERWQEHLAQMADRAAQWDRIQAERFAGLSPCSVHGLTAAGNS